MHARYKSVSTWLLVMACTSFTFAGVAQAGKGCQLDAPAVRCLSSTASSITINICAGATGAPAGISIHWSTCAAYTANGNQIPDPDHGGCNPPGHDNLWPVSSLTIGGSTLGESDICSILQANPGACAKGGSSNGGANAVLILEHQLIAAMFNKASGAIDCAFADATIA